MEYVISKSFSQFQHEQQLPQLQSRLKAVEAGGRPGMLCVYVFSVCLCPACWLRAAAPCWLRAAASWRPCCARWF